jgi:hypothetical protein
MKTGVYAYGTGIRVKGAGSEDHNGDYFPGIANSEMDPLQWVKPSTGLVFIYRDGTPSNWFINADGVMYISVEQDKPLPSDCTFIPDDGLAPGPTVTRIVEPLQDILDALQF